MSKGGQPRMQHGQPSKGNMLKATALLAEQKRIQALLDRHDRAVAYIRRRNKCKPAT